MEDQRIAVGGALPHQHLLAFSTCWPPNEAEVRRFDGDGDVHRTIPRSPGSARSERSAESWSGCSANASSPPATALRVVLAPG